MSALYHDGHRRLQDRFDTRRLADPLDERIVHDRLSDQDRAFIQHLDMFFFATAEAQRRPNCSDTGGDPGFVRVLDERTLAFPSWDGNGMDLSLGHLALTPPVGLLFIDFEQQRRLRLNGVARIDERDPLVAAYPGTQLVVRVVVRQGFPHCPRYLRRLQRVERSAFVPRPGCTSPVPDWNKSDLARDVLPANDPRGTHRRAPCRARPSRAARRLTTPATG